MHVYRRPPIAMALTNNTDQNFVGVENERTTPRKLVYNTVQRNNNNNNILYAYNKIYGNLHNPGIWYTVLLRIIVSSFYARNKNAPLAV